jgi:hypothetical protein
MAKGNFVCEMVIFGNYGGLFVRIYDLVELEMEFGLHRVANL